MSRRTPKTFLQIGDRVKLGGSHPLAGCSGNVISFRHIYGFGERPFVRLDNDWSCFVMRPESQAKKAND